MSVATHLGLDPAGTALVELEREWASWVAQYSRLARAGDIRSLRDWLAAASPAEADNVLHALATLGSPSGGDNLAAASALAWALLPGACALAHRLRALSPRIDEMVAAQLWAGDPVVSLAAAAQGGGEHCGQHPRRCAAGIWCPQPTGTNRQGMEHDPPGRSIRQLLGSTR